MMIIFHISKISIGKIIYHILFCSFIKIKNIVQRVFGSKFHITFPNRRRREDSTCGIGIWPTNQNERYQTLGVDVRASYYSDVSDAIDYVLISFFIIKLKVKFLESP